MTCRCSTRPASQCRRVTEGAIAIKLPLPPGTFPTLWHDDERYVSSYLSAYPGYYLTGDGGLIDEDGYIYVMGRTDDVLNVAGHRLSTGSIEAALAGHPAVAECAVIGVPTTSRARSRGARRAQGRVDADAEGARITQGARAAGPRRGRCGGVAAPGRHRRGLPKTRSGKILRKTMREIADGKTPTIPGTIEDAGACSTGSPLADTKH
jgi:propionyl-CoA synthetase